MKNAEELAKAIINTPPYSQRTGREWTDAIAKALQDAYRKGAEDMKRRAAEVVIKEHETCQEWGCEISNKILSLPLTEGGAR